MSKADIRIPKISFKWAVLGASLIGFMYSFGLGYIVDFRSWTLSPLIDFENERLIVYFLAFLLGSLSYQQAVFVEIPKSKKLYNVVNGIAWIPVTLHIFARLWPFFYPNPAEFTVTPLYRLAYWASFHLSLPVLAYVVIESFRRYLDKNGRLWNELNRNSYGVYIIHVIMIGFLGTLLLNLNLPALAKYPALIILTYLGSNLTVSLYRAIVQTVKSSRDKPAAA